MTCLEDFLRLKAILPLDRPFQLQEEAHAVPHAHTAPHATHAGRLAAACLGLHSWSSSCTGSGRILNKTVL